MSKPASKAPPFLYCPWEVADAGALQALARGDASAEQQRRALDWVVRVAAGTYNATFHPGQPDASAFAEGRRFVGLEVVKLLNLNLSAFRKDDQNG